MAIRIFNGVTNGMGGIDWAGVEPLAELYGYPDTEDLLHRLVAIKRYRPDGAEEE